MSVDFDRSIDRLDTGSSKWSRYPADVLPLWVADMDFAVSPTIVAALRERLEHPVFGYGVPKRALKERIVSHLAETYSWRTRPEDIVFLPGVEPGINMALGGLLSPGDGVTVQTPVYPPILKAPEHWGLKRIEQELLPGDGDSYRVDMDGFGAAVGVSRALLLCNPHNPLGKVFSRDELEKMAAVCLAHETLIISDEIHCDLVFDGREHVPIASLDDAVAERCITLMAASKSYNIAGLKTAFAVIQNRTLRDSFLASKRGMVDSVNVLGYEATLAAYAEGDEWLREVVRYLQGNRDYLVEAVESRLPGISIRSPEGTFLGWLDCSGCGIDGDPHAFFLEKAKVAMNAGSDFGSSGRDFVRINFGCPRAVLEEGIRRIEASLTPHRDRKRGREAMLQEKIEKHASRKDINCAGIIVAAVIEEYGLDLDPTILNATAPMGGGMNIEAFCGTISGCMMALGLLFNKDAPYESGNMKRITQDFFAEYEKVYGSVNCRDLKKTKREDQTCSETVVPRIGEILDTVIRRELERRK